MGTAVLPVTVVIACHSRDRLDKLLLAIDSVRAQEPPPTALVITVDHEHELYTELVERFPDLVVVENEYGPGASGNRNTGAAHAATPLVAFLDDDARARPGWLTHLVEPFADPDVVCTGGFVAPDWTTGEPSWFPEEFAWAVGASHRGLPTTRSAVRNVWSENMAVRRDAFAGIDGFRLEFGKVGAVSRPEDTDLCIRLGKTSPAAKIIFTPDAVVDHHVGPERARFRYFLRRSYLEGRGKVELARINEGGEHLGDERAYLTKTVPQGIVRYVGQAVRRRDRGQLRRAAALACGVLMAAVGGAVSVLVQVTSASRRSTR